jgi:hypothetical protein
MNLVQMICCVLVAKASELGQTYLSNKVEAAARRAQTVDDANRFIESAAQELGIASSDFCKCDAMPTVAATAPDGRRNLKYWQKRKSDADPL